MPRMHTHTFLAMAAALVLTFGPSAPSAQEEAPAGETTGEVDAPGEETPAPEAAPEGGPVAMPTADEPAAGPADLGITFGVGNPPTEEEQKILESLKEDYEIYVQTANEFKRVIANIIKVEYGKRKIQIEKEFGKQIEEEERLEDEARLSAIEYFEEFLAKYPANPTYTPDAMFRLSELYYEQSYVEYDEAMDVYNQQFALYQQKKLAEEPIEPKRDYSKTIDLYVKLFERYPDYRNIDGVYYLLGYCYNEMGEFDAALYAWLGLVCGNNEPYEPGRGLTDYADVEEPGEHPSEGLAAISSAGEAETEVLFGATKIDRYATCEPVKEDTRFYIETWLRIGEYHFDFDYSEDGLANAISAYTEATKDEDSFYYDLALYKLAWSYWRNGDYPEAIKRFAHLVEFSDRKAAETGKSGSELRPEAIQYIALSFWESDWDGDNIDDPVDGLTRLKTAKYLDDDAPWLSEVYLQLGATYLDDNNNDMAIKVYKAYLERPEWANALEAPEVVQKIIEAYDREKDEDSKIAMIAKLSEYGPDSEWAKINKDHPQTVMKVGDAAEYALIQTALKHHQTAQSYKAQAAAKTKQSEREEWYTAAVEQYNLAAQSYKKYLELYPNSPDSYEMSYNLAEAYFWSEQYRPAAEYYLAVRDSQLDNTYQKDSAFMLIKSFEQIQETDESFSVRDEPPEVAMDPAGVPTMIPIPVPTLMQDLIDAQQTYLRLFPEDKNEAPVFAYLAAETNFNYGHWDQARVQYEEIYDLYCTSDVIALYSWQNLTFIASQLDDAAEAKRLALLQKEKACAPVDTSAIDDPTIIATVTDDAIKIIQAAEAKEIMDTYAKAEETGDVELYAKAAVGLEKLHDKEPEAEDADKLLWNAAVSFEKCNKFGSALRVTEKLVDLHPNSDFMGDALFKLGFNSFNSFEYEKSLGYFQAIADSTKFKKHKDRDKAVQNTALILENQQKYVKAAGYWKKFSSLTKDKEKALEAAWRAAECYVKAKQWSQVEGEMKSFALSFYKVPEAAERVVEARWWVAMSYKKRKKEGDFKKNLPAVIEAYNKVKEPDPAAKSTAYAAEAKFIIVEANLSEIEKFKLHVDKPVDKLLKEIESLTKLREQISSQYAQVLGYASPEWVVAAQFRIGYCFEVNAKILLDAPIPKAITKLPDDIRWEAEEQYIAKINELVFPIEDAAKEEYAKALTLSKAAGVMNKWTELTLERLNAYDPDGYPLYKKGKVKGIDLSHTMPSLDLTAPGAGKEE